MRDSLRLMLMFLGFTALVPLRALADPPPAAVDADDLIRQGLELRRQNQEQAALPYFQRAYTVARGPRAAAQLGFAEQALGMWVEAETHLAEARAAVDADSWIKEHRHLLDESAGFVRAHLGWVTVETNVNAADVQVDGHPMGQTPLPAPLRVPIGQRPIELRAAAFRPAGRAGDVTTGPTVRVALPLVSLAGPVTPPPPAADLRAVAPAPTPVAPPLHRRWELWAGVGAAVIVVGAIIIASGGSPAPYPCGGGDRVCAR